MKTVLVLTVNAFLEIIRERTVAILIFGAIILLVLSFFVGSLSFDEQRRIMIHLGFSAIHLSCLAIILFKGSFLIQREIDRQTCLMILSRPVSRFQFLLGHYLALVLLLLVHIVVQGLLMATLLGYQMSWERFLVILSGIFVEMSVILAFIFLATQFVRPVIGLMAGLALFLVGNWLEEMKFFAERAKDGSLKTLSAIIRWSVPNLFLLNYRSEGYLFQDLPNPNFLLLASHFSFWIVVFLILAGMKFSRRDLV